MPRDAVKTKARIIDAATRLFYGEGIRAVSMDAVAERSGLTKKTLYYHFKSKDDLVAAYLEALDQPVLRQYQKWFDEADGDVAVKIEALFTRFAKASDTPRWRGCGFLRTIAELANMPGHPAIAAGAAHKKRFETWLSEKLESEGVQTPALMARQVITLLDGAATVMLIHRDPDYVRSAGKAARALVEQAADKPL